jgi:hypothetical protein
MALIYQAKLSPSKLQLLTAWLPGRPWSGGTAEVRQLAAYRFDDPAGEVGLEGFLLQADDGTVLHVPMTYRGTPLAGADDFLIGTTEHSVLGTRWVYDACADPVWATALATAVLTGGTQAEEIVDMDDGMRPREPTAKVWGSGTPGTQVGAIDAVTCRDEGLTTVVRADAYELVLVRVVGAEAAFTPAPGAQTLTGQWADGEPAVLAGLRPL